MRFGGAWTPQLSSENMTGFLGDEQNSVFFFNHEAMGCPTFLLCSLPLQIGGRPGISPSVFAAETETCGGKQRGKVLVVLVPLLEENIDLHSTYYSCSF